MSSRDGCLSITEIEAEGITLNMHQAEAHSTQQQAHL